MTRDRRTLAIVAPASAGNCSRSVTKSTVNTIACELQGSFSLICKSKKSSTFEESDALVPMWLDHVMESLSVPEMLSPVHPMTSVGITSAERNAETEFVSALELKHPKLVNKHKYCNLSDLRAFLCRKMTASLVGLVQEIFFGRTSSLRVLTNQAIHLRRNKGNNPHEKESLCTLSLLVGISCKDKATKRSLDEYLSCSREKNASFEDLPAETEALGL